MVVAWAGFLATLLPLFAVNKIHILLPCEAICLDLGFCICQVFSGGYTSVDFEFLDLLMHRYKETLRLLSLRFQLESILLETSFCSSWTVTNRQSRVSAVADNAPSSICYRWVKPSSQRIIE